ncbi:hypothetical protein OH76DRAFT_1483328 [Lentinus brumalis]|uniref:Peptidase A1 domain-containing protein n=1 Tax=Lentinus brumalis TaxID=2498619 RepID=A0A371D9A9_9APHY|nr:hypothetical protein OH76DRAFT_1483328 [Polyporus brumalis]
MSFWIRAHRTFGLLPIDRLPASQSDGISIFDANGVVSQISNSLLTSPVSGLMGLGFLSISSSGATSLWQALAESSGTLEVLSLVATVNKSLYTGDINYQPIQEGQEGYWNQELAGLTVNGQRISLDAGSASYAAIDTGTTLIGGPADSISALYAHVSGSEALTGDNAGYYKLKLQRT